MSFTPLAGIVQNKIANKQKDLYDRSESMKQAQELKAQSSNIYGFSKGGKLAPMASCGCDKGSDGIDTDIFKTMEPKAYMEVQRHIGIKPTGVFTDNDKATMKDKAKQSGGTLRSYLESSPKVRLMIGLAEGGIIKAIYKAGGLIHIKPSNKGKFTEYCGGTVTSDCISKGKSSDDPAVRKRATFADNARKWNH
jgi:hypothetical protein